jgi:hypothetical protein
MKAKPFIRDVKELKAFIKLEMQKKDYFDSIINRAARQR